MACHLSKPFYRNYINHRGHLDRLWQFSMSCSLLVLIVFNLGCIFQASKAGNHTICLLSEDPWSSGIPEDQGSSNFVLICVQILGREILGVKFSGQVLWGLSQCFLRCVANAQVIVLVLDVGNGNPLQYSCLKNLMDRGTWRATVQWAAKSRTQLSNWACIQ